MHLVGFITRIYHDAQSPESQISPYVTVFDKESLGQVFV